MNTLRSFASRERNIVAAIILLAALVRLAWLVSHPQLEPYHGESTAVALNIIQHGEFANALGPESGPSAHVMPATVALSVLAYLIFSPQAAEWALSLVAIGLVSLSIGLAYRVMRSAGASQLACTIAGAFVAVMPIQLAMEVGELRAWEGAIAVCLLLERLHLGIRELKDPARKRRLCLAVLAAITMAVNQAAGLGAGLILAFILLRQPPQQWIKPTLAYIATVLLLLGPWVVRNEIALGRPILFRDNVGLEINLANSDEIANAQNRHDAFLERFKRLHPFNSPSGYHRMMSSGGELPYYDEMAKEAAGWVRSNPLRFLSLCLERYAEMLFPPEYVLDWWQGTRHSKFVALRLWPLWLTSAVALIGLSLLALRKPSYRLIAIAILIPLLPYAVAEPTMRYRYLASTLLIFVGIDVLTRSALLAWHRLQARRADAAEPA